jgi:Flp pilus assembly protein TadG
MIVWCLGLAILLLVVGGISLDLWHPLSEERALQSDASAAAAAGASGLDVAAYRANGQVVLDPGLAVSLAEQNLAQQPDPPTLSAPPTITVSPDGEQITVQLRENVHLTLLGIVDGNHPIPIVATGSAAPRASGAP